MKIVNIDFKEILPGLYISEGKKGLVIEMFDLTGLDKNVDFSKLSAEVILQIEEYVWSYADTIEAIVFDNRKYWELDLGDGFVLDLEGLCSVFPKLKTVACGGGEFLTTDYPDDLRLMSGWDFCDLARTACRNGELEKADYYYQWAEIVDFYDCMHTIGIWLEENGRYDEAEKHFKKIAGEKDKYGAVNNSYAILLDKLGRTAEAQKYLRYVLHGRAYEDAKEFANVFLFERMQDENSPYWQILGPVELDYGILDYIDSCNRCGKTPDIERILLNASGSNDEYYSTNATTRLLQIYGTGKYVYDVIEGRGVIDVVGFPNLDKFKELASTTYESPLIRALYLDFVEEDLEFETFEGLSDNEAEALEAALLTIDVGREILFWLYFNGEYEAFELGEVRIPQLIDQRKAAELLGNNNVWSSIMEYSDLFFNSEYTEKCLKLLEEAHAIYPDNADIALELLMTLLGTYMDRFVDLIKHATRDCLAGLLETYDEHLSDALNEIESADDLEKYLLSIIEACSENELDEHDLIDFFKDLMLELYTSGCSESIDSEYPSLKNSEKAAAFAEKYNLELACDGEIF